MSKMSKYGKILELNKRYVESLSAYARQFLGQMDKFSLADVRACHTYCQENNLPVILAVAGGVNANNAADYVSAGAGLLVTSAPYHAEPKDVQVTFSALK